MKVMISVHQGAFWRNAGKPLFFLILFQAAEKEFIAHLDCIQLINIAVNQLGLCCIFKILVSKIQIVLCLHQVIQQALVICVSVCLLFEKWEQRATSLSVFGLERAAA